MSLYEHGANAFAKNAERRLRAVCEWLAMPEKTRTGVLAALWNMRALRQEAAHAAPRLARLCERMELAMTAQDARQDRSWQEKRNARLRIACWYLLECARSLDAGLAAPAAPSEIARWLEPPLPRPNATPPGEHAPGELAVIVEEGVVRLRVPRPHTPHDQLSLIWRLQRMPVEILPYKEWIVDLSSYWEVPPSLLGALALLEQRLRAAGCRCRIAGPGRPAACRAAPDPASPALRHDAARGLTPSAPTEDAPKERLQPVTDQNARRTGVNAIKTDDLERLVLEHIETLYNVAMQLTHDIDTAETLTERTLIRAFRCGFECVGARPIKSRLLTLLRTTFMEEFARDPLAEPCFAAEDCLSSRGAI